MQYALHLPAFRRALTVTVVSALLCLLLVVVAVPALAATTVTWSGNILNNPDGAFDLTNCVSTVGSVAFNYQVQAFYVDTDGPYTIEVTSADYDTWYVLYEGSFDPANPLTNCVTFDDDGGTGLLSRIVRHLSANTTYILVTTRCSVGVPGTFTNQISGPGNIFLIEPEDSTSAGAAGPARRPDDRLNWMNGDDLAVIYSRDDDADNPAIHVYCVGENSEGVIGLVVTQADLQGIAMPPASNTLVASSTLCDVEFYVLTTGEYQINVRAESGKVFATVMADLAGTSAYGYMLTP